MKKMFIWNTYFIANLEKNIYSKAEVFLIKYVTLNINNNFVIQQSDPKHKMGRC